MFSHHKRTLLLVAIIALWLATSACSCSDLFATLGKRDGTPQPTNTPTTGILAEAQRGLTAEAGPKTATPRRTPTRTPRPTRTPTPTPTRATHGNTPAPTSEGFQGIPTTPNTPFDVTLTEEQINDYLAGQVVSESGVEVSDPQVTVGDDEVLVHVNVYHEVSNIRVGLTVRGAPMVYEGGLYVRVDEVTLDDTVKGFTRLLARTVIDAALRQYTGEHGIAIPVEQVEFERVEVTPGRIRVVGRTR